MKQMILITFISLILFGCNDSMNKPQALEKSSSQPNVTSSKAEDTTTSGAPKDTSGY